MKKIITKFWGVAFILVLLSTLFVGAVPQAAAMNYLWFNSFATPGSLATDVTLMPAAGYNILAVAQSGSTIVCTTSENVTNTSRLYRSTDGGITWTRVIPTVAPTAGNWTLIALAPDDPNIIAIVTTDPNGAAAYANPDTVWVSKNGGTTFARLTNLTVGAFINGIAISPKVGGISRITVGGNTAFMSTANLTETSNSAYLVTYDLDAIAPAWTAPTGFAALSATDDNVLSVAYSPNYLADYALLFVNFDMAGPAFATTGAVTVHCYSYNTNLLDALVEASFPRALESAATSSNASFVLKVNITLDANFFLGDEASQIGFVGATILRSTIVADNATATAAVVGGVYRFDGSSIANTMYQIYTGNINTVAWDGSNLMAADYNTAASMGPLLVRRSANAGFGSPVPTFAVNSIYKAPGTGFDCKVLFNATSGNGYAFSQGPGCAIAKTTDYGKSFNGYKLVNSHFTNLMDWWVSPTGSVIYALTTDNMDTNLWKGTLGFGYSWERVFILNHTWNAAIAGDPNYMVRADADNPDNVYLGLQAAVNMFKSTDGGTAWTPRSCSQNIRDFAVQDANTVYVAVNLAGTIVKTTSGGLSWSDPPTAVLQTAGGTTSVITILADNNLLVGGTLGGVAYTTDGAAWTYIAAPIFGAFGGGFCVLAASGLAAGDYIYLGNGFELARWQIGTSFMWNESIASGAVNGIALANGVLYTYDVAANDLHRWLYPTSTTIGAGIAGSTDTLGNPGSTFNNVGKPIINPLRATTGASMFGTPATNLWARNANENKDTVDTLNQWTEFLFSASAAPVPTYPTNDTLIPINSINGAVSAFNFVWNAPASLTDTGVLINYNYNVAIYLDEGGTNIVAGSPTIGQLAANVSAPQLSLVAAPAAYAPGTTYYWRVRTDAGAPVESYWSAMQSFVIEQLVAIVPVIASPENGGEVSTVTPAFSWSPIAGATSYRFELASDAAFSNIIYTVDPTTAGASVPSASALTRGSQYFWHVKTLTPLEGEWSATANFIVAELPEEQGPPVIVTTAPAPTIIITQTNPPGTTTVIPPAVIEEKVVNPSYIWAIIIVGAVLVIAVIILIVRTRRTV